MKKISILIVVAVLVAGSSFGQGREFLRKKIQDWGQCKNVAMTLKGGDVALYGRNGYASNKIPEAMKRKLQELNAAEELIDDVVLTENESWLILWGNNGYSSQGCPQSLLNKLSKWNDENEVINSVTFNDQGDWIVVGATKYSASNENVLTFIQEGEARHGELWAAHLTEDGMVLCFAKGYKYLGNVPANLKEKLKETSIDVYRIKFLSDGSYFFADKKGNYAYNM